MEQDSLKILLAEDDKNLGTILKAFLDAKGYPAKLCVNGKEALQEYKMNEYDFCIVDIMMPVMDGYSLAKEIRNIDKKIPILFLTAKSMQEDKMRGFELGADDYLTKPFNMEELLARIKAIYRRLEDKEDGAGKDNIYTIGSLKFEYNHQLLQTPEKEVKLTSKESELLKLLCEHKNDTVDRSLALTRIWHDDSYFNARSMDVYITKLRKYLKADSNIELMNVHGVGFKLIAD